MVSITLNEPERQNVTSSPFELLNHILVVMCPYKDCAQLDIKNNTLNKLKSSNSALDFACLLVVGTYTEPTSAQQIVIQGHFRPEGHLCYGLSNWLFVYKRHGVIFSPVCLDIFYAPAPFFSSLLQFSVSLSGVPSNHE